MIVFPITTAIVINKKAKEINKKFLLKINNWASKNTPNITTQEDDNLLVFYTSEYHDELDKIVKFIYEKNHNIHPIDNNPSANIIFVKNDFISSRFTVSSIPEKYPTPDWFRSEFHTIKHHRERNKKDDLISSFIQKCLND